MDDIIKYAFYAVVGIIYIWMQLRKKTKTIVEKTTQTQRKESRPVYNDDPFGEVQKPVVPKQVTLEDLMRQFGMGPEEEIPNPQPVIEKKFVEEVDTKPKKYQKEEYDESYIDEEETALEKVKQDMEASLRLKKQREGLADEHFNSYALDSNQASKYAKLLRDPESIRTAFIMSEIFNRKYF